MSDPNLGILIPAGSVSVDYCELLRRCHNIKLNKCIDDEEVRELDGQIRTKFGMNHEEVMASMAISAPDTHATIMHNSQEFDGPFAPYLQKLLLVLTEFDESFMDQLVGGYVAACLWP